MHVCLCVCVPVCLFVCVPVFGLPVCLTHTGTHIHRHTGTHAHRHTGDKKLHIHLPKVMPVGTALPPLASIKTEEINFQEGTAIYTDQAAYET